mgnify:CR=1 FL=1
MQTSTMTWPCTSQGSRAVFAPEQSFDRTRMRRLMEGQTAVLHCHHYATLFTQLALDAEQFNGPALLARAAAEAFGGQLRDYLSTHGITEPWDRIAIAEQYFAFMGFGEMKFECSQNRAAVTMRHSHIDEGWKRKWGQRREPLNYVGCGYIQGAIAAIYDLREAQMVTVRETQSIVCGATSSKFEVTW